MSVGAITSSLMSTASNAASTSGTSNFTAALSAATGATSVAAGSVSNPFGQLGTDLQSFLVQLGGKTSEAKDTNAATASANSTAGLHSLGHSHHHDATKSQGSGDLATDFANSTIN